MFLSQYLQHVFQLSASQCKHVLPLFEVKHLKKGEEFQTSGQLDHGLLIVESGIVREYFLDDGKEITKWISKSNGIIVDLATFLNQQPCRFSLQAIQETVIHRISYANYQLLTKHVPDWSKKETELIAKCFTIIEERLMQFLTQSAEERYQAFFSHQKELFNEVPQQHIAAMLGMSPETLSRLRAKH